MSCYVHTPVRKLVSQFECKDPSLGFILIHVLIFLHPFPTLKIIIVFLIIPLCPGSSIKQNWSRYRTLPFYLDRIG